MGSKKTYSSETERIDLEIYHHKQFLSCLLGVVNKTPNVTREIARIEDGIAQLEAQLETLKNNPNKNNPTQPEEPKK